MQDVRHKTQDNTGLFPNLEPNARIWVYQSNRLLSPGEVKEISEKAHAFVQSWSSHSRKVESASAIVYDRFVVLAANEAQFQVSGCSIDSSVHFIKSLGQEYGIDFFDRFNIAYKTSDKVEAVNRKTFEQLIAEGKVNEDTIVFNNLVTTLNEFTHHWELPLKESWHYKVFVS